MDANLELSKQNICSRVLAEMLLLNEYSPVLLKELDNSNFSFETVLKEAKSSAQTLVQSCRFSAAKSVEKQANSVHTIFRTSIDSQQ
ncbi:PREDICTED: uncharacterized protein LOC109215616 isoform X3 [Nicotiana attenuata]|uniref:Uncharacterized protein n=1 Tax=Nicotiana attenuata TaxID=49451 RepID=A0A1J6K859_NICAT|nr:PREDICTED: uncharacterized protein LOC109215616 isoform X3 [Nicotiana attenuata]OIT26205.1 hypothetical protein A4A49_39603 [Nicotiana attenuata]